MPGYGYPEYDGPRLGPALRGLLLVIGLLCLDAALLVGAGVLSFRAAFGVYGGEVFLASFGAAVALIALSAYALLRRDRAVSGWTQVAVASVVVAWVLYVWVPYLV
ncbi:hypothetical protein [Streptomyces sp. TRM64462]|uniref:hypothetical protein n=1 Tax=Streptomyces sp. TRM64462 TaxID=2741726 RepID=UPI001586C974|nr:hypothetical protein [Streptomyces sp. TRM64462]